MISGYVPFYNNRATLLAALQSVANQDTQLIEVFALDDGSTDGAEDLLDSSGIRCLSQPINQGRGAVRKRALLEADGDFVVCCDATNVLPLNFVSQLVPWFDDPKVAAVYGRIQDLLPCGAIGRWRARHLFKADHFMSVRHKAPLSTYGTLVRKSAVLAVGNFNPELRHTEDYELGERLIAAGYDIVFDPSASVLCNVQNTLGQVLERYWRWYAGIDESISLHQYSKNILYSLKCMVLPDLLNREPRVALISLICPHYQFWRSLINRIS
jgi:cellulose synthase/poly-beta-1,6-N-acetylglucosamine synthase-like glycosyltransferase